MFSPLRHAWHGIFDYDDVKDQNDQLRQQIEPAGGRLHRGGGADPRAARSCGRWTSLPVRSDIPTVVAEVVGDPPSNFQQTVEINQGADKGIQVGMAVITPAGLVGRISRVSTNTSVVRLITDPAFQGGVKVSPAPVPATTVPTTAPPAAPAQPAPADAGAGHHGRPRYHRRPRDHRRAPAGHRGTPDDGRRQHRSGPARGRRLRALPTVGFIDIDATVNEGDPVVTSGIRESLFPADIPVGRVAEVKRTPGSLQLDVRVEPAADLAHLTFVAVVRYLPAE